jgi:thioredoxin-like negative regulator of GroEL
MENHRLLKFEASWCAPCRYMSPIIEGVLNDGLYSDVELVNVNIDDEIGQDTARAFSVRSIPTLILMNDRNQIVNILIGTASEDQVREFLSKR